MASNGDANICQYATSGSCVDWPGKERCFWLVTWTKVQ